MLICLVAAVAIVGWVLAPADGESGASPEEVELDANGFPVVGEPLLIDTGSGSPARIWGSVECERRTRLTTPATGGDPHPPADGVTKGSTAFRRLTVVDGDDFSGERCELGRNNQDEGPTAVYHEGERRITFISVRLGKRLPLRPDAYQVVAQLKQTQPATGADGPPALALHAYEGRWRLVEDTEGEGGDKDGVLWSVPAVRDQWTRFAIDALFSADPDAGWVRVYVDRNGDGDAADPGERSPRFEIATLRRQPDDVTDEPIPAGAAIPSHLRAGIYHDEIYRCPDRRCTVDIDNVGIYDAPE